jgi:hypothetical protein
MHERKGEGRGGVFMSRLRVRVGEGPREFFFVVDLTPFLFFSRESESGEVMDG